MTAKMYKIGELSEKTGLSVPAIRFYEQKGIIKKAERTLSNHRVYREDTLERLLFIERCKEAGMPLECISRFLAYKQDHSIGSQDLLDHIEQYLAEIERRRQALDRVEVFLKETKSELTEELTQKD